jgi:hypothetical protein
MTQTEQNLRDALEKIMNWELPPTGKFWDREQTEPMSYEACWGSNGVRDYMKQLAHDVLINNPPVNEFLSDIILSVDNDNVPMLELRHHDKNNSLHAKMLGLFVRNAMQNGIHIVHTKGFLGKGESFEDYEIKTK